MFAPPVSGLAAGFAPTPNSRGSALTPLDGLRPLPADGPFTGTGIIQTPMNRGRPGSTNPRPQMPSPLAASGRMGTATSTLGGAPVQATNLSEADNIKVAVRVRPLFPHETDKGGTTVVQVSSNTTIKVVVPGPAGTSMQRDFAFHACLGPEVGQADVLHLCGVPQLLDAALAGYNVTVFAYGQTGSGKTYTMSGREEVIGSDSYSGDSHDDGIITRSIQHLFGAMEARKAEAKFSVAASYLEIYNEGIFDLLNLKAKNLPVKWDAALGFFVPGLKQVSCSRIDTMMEVIRTGMKHRHVGSHELNIESSRSHSIMTMCVHATPLDPSAADFGTPRLGKISFVDLAGSERLKDTKSEGVMLKETANINKSLFVLGKVIAALAERDSSGTSAHIPYRDSKLTKLLMDSLGGNALALMIACCSPASTAVEETLSTLSYATRAKNIQNRPTVQYDPKEAQIANLRREIDLLRQENLYLREQVRQGGGHATTDMGTPLHASRPAWPPYSAGGISIGGDVASPPLGHPSWPPLAGGDAAGGSRDSSRDSARDGGGGGAAAAGPLPPPSAHLPSRLVTPRVGAASSEGVRNALASAGAVTHLEPLRMSSETAAAAAAAGGVAAMLGRRASHTGGGVGGGGGGLVAYDDDLMRRLMDTQNLLARFSEENGRLAKENDRLRAGRQLLSQEHGEVLDEIEVLRSKLVQLETAVLSGSQTPNAVKAALQSAIAESGVRPRADSPSTSTSASASASASTGNHSGPGSAPRSPLLLRQYSPGHTSPSPPPPPLPPPPSSHQQQLLQQQQQQQFWSPNGGYGQYGQVESPYHPPGSALPPPPSSQGGYASIPGGSATPPQHHHSIPHPQLPGGPGGAGGVANVMAVGGAPGNAGAMRTRGQYGGGGGGGGPGGGGGGKGGGGGGGDDSIIVADRTKLALLLGDGPIEPAVPVRPVPIKPPEPSYANPAKAHHVQHIQKQLQRGGGGGAPSNPSSPTGTHPGG
ncbi:hypothetical protein PLESTB_000792000 [Pleodorina starrii]|uniref:Kinesin-like protein n=1 Tax=Pleodorina starrii TaxID=330485 RepID=A0A9W6BKB2_9CHLO|nr:hypothetical protein PLESTM_001006000 [Pleodorina starrii]GLC53831.1 hypothetical protein PLESTB_000792000 [Pleodorina starrii]GLC73011.1 hypothetical protein PLESTF_001319600 [Pleodorina starrii]